MSADVARQAQLVPPLGSDLDRTFTALDIGFTAVRRLAFLWAVVLQDVRCNI